jgi:hypothetical protein
MRRLSIGFIIGAVLAVLHLGLAIYAFSAYINCKSSTAGLVFIIFFWLDAPLLLLPKAILKVFGEISPLVNYGILGSALWFIIPYLIDMAFTRIFPNIKKLVRVIIIVVAIPAVLFGFTRLSHFAIRLSIQQERPAELKKSLNKESSGFLTEKIVFEDETEGIRDIYIFNSQENDTRFIGALRNGIIFLDNKYQEQNRIYFGELGFNSIQPFIADANYSYRLLAYRFGKGIYIFNEQGKELWNFIKSDKYGIGINGASFGDVDGDGKTEIVVFYPYTQGMQLMDGDGNIKWSHSVDALGHLEMADIDDDGKAEIIYDNSNNARGATTFKMLDAAGAEIKKLEIATKSYEFAMIKWPNAKLKPNILLTENSKIRIMDLKGDTVISLDAPGCREFGNVKAAAVKLKKQQPPYLVVRKGLHPDLLVMYVYDNNGKLVYQRTDVLKYGVSNATIAVVPENEIEGEKILVEAFRNNKEVILEYCSTQ